MAIFLNDCMDSADYVAVVTGYRYRPKTDVITLKELMEISKDPEKNSGFGFYDLRNYWNYPLSEIPDLMSDEYSGTTFALVRFKAENNNNYEYRMCEI